MTVRAPACVQEYAQAIDTYTRLIATSSTGDDKELIALHSNRAAARIAAGCFEEACSDCTAAIARLLGEFFFQLAFSFPLQTHGLWSEFYYW